MDSPLERVGSATYCWQTSTNGLSGIFPFATSRSAAAISARLPPTWTVPARRDSASSNGHSQTRSVVGGLRHEALERTRTHLGLAFGDDPDDPLTQLLARLILAAVDGAFVAHRADPELTHERILLPFARSAADDP